MNCLEFRRQVGAEPSLNDPVVTAHSAACPTCAAYREQLLALDRLLVRAMRIPLEPAARQAPRGRPATRRWLALAASVVVGVLVGATLWVSYPAPTLAGEVIGHVRHEPDAWDMRDPLGAEAIEAVLGPHGVRLKSAPGDVTFARRCFFEFHWVPHLVVQTANGPVTVLWLAHREVEALARVEEHEFAGVVLPAPRGSIAIVGRDVPGLDEIARQVFEAVEWDV
jgi:hypothetical protein